MEILRGIFLVLQALLSIALVLVVMAQTTKSDGLVGTTSGPVTSSFKGKPGVEEQVRTYTIYISIAWFVVSIVAALLYSR